MQSVSVELICDPSSRVRQLSDAGRSVVVDNKIPALRYLRSGPQMEKMARTYYSEGQLEQAFILYNKFATLFVEKLPKHPGYAKLTTPEKARVKKLLKPAFERAMELKNILTKRFEEEKAQYILKMEAEREAEMARIREVQEKKEKEQAEALAAFLSAGSGSTSSTTKNEPTDAQPPPAYEAMSTEQDSVSPVEEKVEEDEESAEDNWVRDDMLLVQQNYDEEEEQEESQQQQSEADTSESLTATHQSLAKVLPDTYQRAQSYPQTHPQAPPTDSSVSSSTSSGFSGLSSGANTVHHYASQPPPSYQTADHAMTQSPMPYYPPPDPIGGNYGPPPPPVATYYDQYGYQAPPVVQPPPSSSNPVPYTPMAATSVYQNPPPSSGSSSWDSPHAEAPSSAAPVVDRSKKPTCVLTSLGGLSQEGMRVVSVPSNTSSAFLQLASNNTRRDVETCGILAGKFAHNKLRVTHIIVPKQTGKSDSCETLNEEELFDVQDKYDLITLGWIHTHPSQTSFMSSVDLHTHCSYQLMLEEAIAIVCAPRYNQNGIFTLTQPHGLDYITNCTQRGFHSHPKEPPLYEECKHIKFVDDAVIEIIDLR